METTLPPSPPVMAATPPPSTAAAGKTPPSQPPMSPPRPATTTPATGSDAAASEADEETRVITLDTIIRKGLTERMPMTAKDVVNIVSMSMQKERERQAADRLRLAANQQNATATSPVATAFGTLNRTTAAASSPGSGKSDSDSTDTDYDSHNDDQYDDDDDDGDEEADDNSVADATKPPAITPTPPAATTIKLPTISVIQRAPPVCNEMQLADDLRASNAQSNAVAAAAASSSAVASSSDELPPGEEDCDLRSGDLYYSESNTSDYSDAEHHAHHRYQHPNLNRQNDALVLVRRKQGRNKVEPIAGVESATVSRKRGSVTAASGDDESTAGRSCTDSKRNAILLQCSAAALAKVQRRSPVVVVESESAPAADLLNVESMLQVQHCMDDDDDDDTDDAHTDMGNDAASPPLQHLDDADEQHSISVTCESPIVIKQERLTPDDEMLEILHVEPYQMPVPALQQVPGKKVRGGVRGGKVLTRKVSVANVKQSTKKTKSTGASMAIENKLPTIQAVYSGVNPCTSAAILATRDRRQSAAKSLPVYAELSDNDSQLDASKPKSKPKQRSPKASASAKSTPPDRIGSDVATTPKLHWKTQLKLQRQQKELAAAAEALDSPKDTSGDDTEHITETADDDVPSDVGDDDDKEDDCIDTGSSASSAHNTAVNKIIEPPHNQKRIPKLKYNTFNFSDRRGAQADGPKMVSKYKKKYKRKPKSVELATIATAASVETVIDDRLASPSTSTAVRPLPVVKPEVLDATAVATLNNRSVVRASRKATTKLQKRKYTRSVTAVSEPPRKQSRSARKLLNPVRASGNSTGAARPPDTIHSLRAHNQLLLDYFEQRINEIRQLKQRLAHMQHTNGLCTPPTVSVDTTVAAAAVTSNGCAAVRPKLEPGLSPAASDAIAERQPSPVAVAGSDSTSPPDWSVGELAQAHSLYALQPLLYAHLHQCFALPLPQPAECAAWSATVGIECGRPLTDMLRLLSAAGAHLDALQRVAVLHITDLPLRPSFEYTERTDRLRHVPGRRLHVVWARGLHADWQLPLYVSTVGVAELVPAVHSAIVQLHAIQYNVIACCARLAEEAAADSDGDGATDGANNNTNSGTEGAACAAHLWQQLGVSRGYSYFSHPVTNEPVYTFYFGDDLLRSVQRQLLQPGDSGGFCTVDRPPVRLTRQPLDELRTVAAGWYAAASSDARTLFSARTAELLRAVRPGQYAVCADFVDVFAGYARLMFESEYGGERLEAQMQTLSHVQLQLYKLRCGADGGDGGDDGGASTGGGVPIFKAATAHTIESLKLLQHTMRQKYGRDAFPAQAVSVDCLRQRWSTDGTAGEPPGSAPSTVPPRTLLDTITRLHRMCVPRLAHAHSSTNGSAGPSPTLWSSIDVTQPERYYVQRLIDGMVRPYAALAERQKFAGDLWRMEERFQALWSPFYVSGNRGGAGAPRAGDDASALVMDHVLRDTLGKLKPAASLECAVRFMQQRIALRVAVVNELGGMERWPSYMVATAAAERRSRD